MATKEDKALATQGTTAIAQYGEWTPEQMEKESAEIGSSGDFWKVPVGRTVVRFLPPKIGWPSPFVIRHSHFIELPGLTNAVSFSCPKAHEGKICLACKKADELETSGNSRDAKMAQRLRPSKRIAANIIVGPNNPDQKVQVWEFGKTVYDQLKAIREDDAGGGNFLDPMKGFNISVKRVGTGKDDTKYTLTPARDITKLANMEWIEVQRDLRRLVRIPTVDQQKRLLDGEDPRDVWNDSKDDDDQPRRSRKRGDDDAIDVDDDKRTAEDDLFDDEVDLD